MDDPGHDAAPAPPAATFTREELDAAEPERRPSTRRRWLVGIGIGAVGGTVVGLQGFLNPLVLLSLPFAFTAAGSGALVGAGLVWTVALLFFGSGIVASGDPLSTLAWGSSVVVLAAGALGSWMVARRQRAGRGRRGPRLPRADRLAVSPSGSARTRRAFARCGQSGGRGAR